jgi:hypothetical protein
VPAPEPKRGPARLQLALVAALFLGPLIAAVWMYYGSSYAPAARSNHGLLLEPVVHLTERHPGLSEVAQGQWLLLYAHDGACDDACNDALYTLRQSRLMLGHDMNRLTRVFLHGPFVPDKVLLDEKNTGLEALQDDGLALDLWSTLSGDIPRGGYFLIDPHGNLVMYFRSNLNPHDMVDDIKHLLKLSRIG